MRILFFTLISTFIISNSLFAQKIKIKDDVVYADETPVFKIETSNLNKFTLFNLNNEKLAIFNAMDYYDSNEISNANPKGRVAYFDVTFLNPDMDKCEIPINGLKKSLAKEILQNDLVKNNGLDETAVKQYVRINGFKFSEQRNRSTTIIINNR